LAQTYKDIRVMVFDNASCDATRDVVRDLMAMDSRVEYFCHSRNIGMIGNFNVAFSSVTTPYFGFLSDDDYFLETFVDDAMQAFHDHPPIQFAVFSAPTIDENGAVLSNQLSAWPKEGLYAAGESIITAISGAHPVITTCIFRLGLAAELHFDQEADSIADLPILISILAKHPFYLSKKVGGYFIRHADSSGNNFAKLKNFRRLCPAYVRVENLVRSSLPNDLPARDIIIRTLERRIDKTFFFLMLESLTTDSSDSSDYLQERILERSPSVWQIAGRFLCLIYRRIDSGHLASGLSFFRRALRGIRRRQWHWIF
jgi:glycosyltransferase involved in cell wall biosynthesis